MYQLNYLNRPEKTNKLMARFTFVLLIFAIACCANDLPAHAQTERDATINSVEIGFSGRWCLGRWVPLRIFHSGNGIQTVVLETADGDGVPIQYRFPAISTRFQDSQFTETLVRIGRYRSYLNVSLRDADDNIVAEKKLRIGAADGLPEPQPSTASLTLSLGADLGLDSFIAAGKRERIALYLDNLNQLPTQLAGLDSVERMLMTTEEIDLASWTDAHSQVIHQWVFNGGHLIISTGKTADQWFGAQGKLKSILNGEMSGPFDLQRSDALEIYATPADRLIQDQEDPLAISLLKLNETAKDDVTQNQKLLIGRRAFGFGQITFVTFDLNNPKIAQWNGRNQLVSRLLSDAASSNSSSQSETQVAQEVAGVGYTDLSGQLRVPLDQFEGVGFINFTTVALLVAAFILLVGPGDYFLNKYVFKRMQMTWITFPAITLLFCGIAYWIYSASKPEEFRINHVEVVDLDATSGHVRGWVWAQIYSPQTDTRDVRLPNKNTLDIELSGDRLGWQGLPGTGLGGMQTRARSSLIQQSYSATQTDNRMELKNVPIQVASSKPLFASYQGQLKNPVISELTYDVGVSEFSGSITNPLNVELTNCAIFYKNFLIPLNNSLGPGETFDVEFARTQSFESFIKRRTGSVKTENGSEGEVNSRWDKKNTNIPRILLMMMFYNATGDYSELTNGYMNKIDLSSHLDLNRAILIGRVKSAATPLQIDNQPANNQLDTTWTMVRIVYPVKEVSN